ncbi:MAG: hypothetical protein CME06_10935 [Gemmatimonadetes bacterium]|nr:hypothetical protein [Gemmatimonadota bacterium]
MIPQPIRTALAALSITLLPALSSAIEGATEELHLSDLADGETRLFGEGGHAISATRDGDIVTVSLPGVEGDEDHEIVVDLSEDDGHVVVVGEDEHRAVWVKAGGELDAGEVEIEIEELDDEELEGAQVIIRKMITVEDDEDGENTTSMMRVIRVGGEREGGEGEEIEIDVEALVDELGEEAEIRIMKIHTEEGDEGTKVMVRIEADAEIEEE